MDRVAPVTDDRFVVRKLSRPVLEGTGLFACAFVVI